MSAYSKNAQMYKLGGILMCYTAKDFTYLHNIIMQLLIFYYVYNQLNFHYIFSSGHLFEAPLLNVL